MNVMKKILVINASANIETSFSRDLSDTFIRHLKNGSQTYPINYRDLAKTEVSHISQRWIEADSKKREERDDEELEILRSSDIYIQELQEADIIVLATPMYNWSIPSSLKAYLDQILRFNETFTTNPEKNDKRYLGMLKNKTLFLLFSRGSQGYGEGERNEPMDFQSKYLKMVFGIMGIDHIHEFAINGTKRKNDELSGEIAKLGDQLAHLIHSEIK